MASNYKLVLVDDDSDNLELMSESLESDDYQVVSFNSANEAFKYIQKNSKEIIFITSDFTMPEMDGLVLRSKMLEAGLNIPFALVTGNFDPNMLMKGMELQICSFLEKPIDYDKLKNLIKENSKYRINQLSEDLEMAIGFIEESSGMLDEIQDLVLKIEENPNDSNAINTYLRILHTIKGTAACVGLDSISRYAHRYEDYLNDVKKKQNGILKSHNIDVMLKAIDCLRAMYNRVTNERELNWSIQADLELFDSQNLSEEESSGIVEHVSKKTDANIDNKKKASEDKIQLPVTMLDHFMELSGELTVQKNTVFKLVESLKSKYTHDEDVVTLFESFTIINKVTTSLQTEISEMRKVGLTNVFKPLTRVVRDTGRSLGKDIQLHIAGDRLRVDTVLAKVLSDSLVHLIRNSIDHGIEKPDVREANSKKRDGNIWLRCYDQGENIFIELEDDGAGVNTARVREKALENKLYPPEVIANMSPQQINALIFHAGFSTAAVVSDVSGRGVGMDMVKSSVEAIGGKVVLNSTPGKGSKFGLLLPIPRSVLIVRSLGFKIDSNEYHVPLSDVAQVVTIPRNEMQEHIYEVEGAQVLRKNENLYPIVDLHKLFKLNDPNEASECVELILLKVNNYNFAIVVDVIENIQEIVVRKFCQQMRDTVFAGATILGDSTVGLVIDSEAIGNTAGIKHEKIDDDLALFHQAKQKVVDESTDYMQFSLLNGKDNVSIPLDVVYRLEEVSCDKIEYTGDLMVYHYRDSLMPIISLDKVLHPESNPSLSSFGNVLNLIVVKKDANYFGLLVKHIKDIGSTSAQVDNNCIVNECFSGTVYISNMTVSIFDVDYFLNNYTKFNLANVDNTIKCEINDFDLKAA